MTDPWADLGQAVAARKEKYLASLVAEFTPGDALSEYGVAARRRGYLRGDHPGHLGKRPSGYTQAQLDDAGKRAGAHTALWYDTPELRTYPEDEVGEEDATKLVARLHVTRPVVGDPTKLALPKAFEAHLPALTERVHYTTLLRVLKRLTVDIVGDIRTTLRESDLFGDPEVDEDDKEEQAKLYNRIVQAIDIGEPAKDDRPYVATDTPVQAAVRRLLPVGLANEVNLILLDDPEAEGHNAVQLLVDLAKCNQQTMSDALVGLASRTLPSGLKGRQALIDRIRAQPYDYPVARRNGLPLPTGWQWPTWDDTGMYWWRTILWRHIVSHILTLKDTADFHTVDLLRLVAAAKLFTPQADARVPEYITTDIKLAFLNFKYWWDQKTPGRTGGFDYEAGKDQEMTFWSENHQILFAVSEYIAGQLWPDDVFAYGVGDGPHTGRQHQEWARVRLADWLGWRLSYGFGEWRAPGYYNEDFPPLFAFVDLCQDAELRTKALLVLDRLVFDLARFTCHGSFGSTAGRAYWEHKAYGWGQSVGDAIEILFGTRGDFQGVEGTAVALATSSYDPPHALLAIGRDRVVLDRTAPFTDRSRVAPSAEEAIADGIAVDARHIAFWWGAMAYFAHTLETTREVVDDHDHLKETPPFNTLYLLGDNEFVSLLTDWLTVTAGLVLTNVGAASAAALPFPANLLAVGVALAGGEMTLEGLWHTVQNYVAIVGKAVHAVGEFLGLVDEEDEPPKIPPSALQSALESLLVQFNQGSVLTRANLMAHSIGDAMLTSAVNHQVGQFAFQKHPWQATLDCGACVWTTAPFSQESGSVPRGWLELFKDLAQLRGIRAAADVALPFGAVHDALADTFGHDGPNHWSGSVSLPFVVQHERALIEAYNLSNLDRTITGARTHAWFPKAQFDETDQVDANDGTWTFGRRGQGYVALFSARKVRWTSEGVWRDKELVAEGGSNIWICHIGNATRFAPSTKDDDVSEGFRVFRDETVAARLTISGIGSTNQLHASFDVPRAEAPAGNAPRLELFFGDRTGRFAGQDLTLDEFPQFENRYVGTVPWRAKTYTITHPQTGFTLTHDLAGVRRSHTPQPDPVAAAPPRRLFDTLTPTRRRRLR